MTFHWTNPTALLVEARERYRVATGRKAARLAAWLLLQSDEALRVAFGYNAGQVTAMKARLTAHGKKLSDLDAVAGE